MIRFCETYRIPNLGIFQIIKLFVGPFSYLISFDNCVIWGVLFIYVVHGILGELLFFGRFCKIKGFKEKDRSRVEIKLNGDVVS